MCSLELIDILYPWPVSLSSTWSLHNLLFPLPISVKEICFLDARHSLCLGRKDQAGVETLITTQISKSTDSSWMVVLKTTQDCLGWKMMSLIWTSWKWMLLRYLKSKSKSWTYGTCLFGVFFFNQKWQKLVFPVFSTHKNHLWNLKNP